MATGLFARRVDPIAALFLGAAIGLGAATRGFHLLAPFGADFDGWLGAMYGSTARNLARAGFRELHFLPHTGNGPLRFGDVTPFLHHPPFLSNLLGLSYRLFGVSEGSTRLFPALAYLAGIVVFFFVARRLLGSRFGALAAFVFAALPMTAIFGGLVNFEPFVFFGQQATYLFYLRHRASGRTADLALMIAFFIAAIFADWFGVFAIVPIGLHALFARPRARARVPVALAVAGAAALAAIFAFYERAWPGAIDILFRAARHRTSNVVSDYSNATYTAVTWLATQADYFLEFYRPAGLLLAAGGLFAGALSRLAPRRRAALHAALLAAMGLAPVIIFRQASFQHCFLSFQVAPALALFVAIFFAAAWDFVPRARSRAFAVASIAVLVLSSQNLAWRYLFALQRIDGYRFRGLALAEAVPFEDGIATPGPLWEGWVTVGFYADRAIATGVASLEALEALRRRPPNPRAPIRHVAVTKAQAAAHEAFVRALASRYRARTAADMAIFDLE
jgi:hypothetical protein